MAGLAEDPGLLRSLHAAITRNPIITDARYVDQSDVSIFRQFQRSWARDEAHLTAHWWKLAETPRAPAAANPWAPERDDDRFLRESDKYGKFTGPADLLAQSSVHALASRLEVTKREGDALRNDLRKASERIDDFQQRFRTLRDENEELRRTSSQYSSSRAELSRVVKEKQLMRERVRELEALNQRMASQLSRRNAQDLLKQESRSVRFHLITRGNISQLYHRKSTCICGSFV